MNRVTRNNVLRCSLGAMLFALCVPGCGGYGTVSPAAYDHAIALYQLCNLQRVEKLDAVAAQIETAHTSGKITDTEAEWLSAIVGDAREGNWEAAAREARKIVADQVER